MTEKGIIIFVFGHAIEMTYSILALSDPFRGGIGVDPTTFEHLVENLIGDITE